MFKHKNDNQSRPVFRGLEHLKEVHAQYCNSIVVLVAAAPLWNEERGTRRRPRRVAALLVLHMIISTALGSQGLSTG